MLHFSSLPASSVGSFKVALFFSLRKKEFGLEKMDQRFNITLFFSDVCMCMCVWCPVYLKDERRKEGKQGVDQKDSMNLYL